jgi:DNA-binding GntR family transcriptional regulator
MSSGPQHLAAALRKGIREGRFAPGDELIQEELATRLGVSRIPLREALRILSGEGLVTLKHGQGAFVTKLNVREVEELYELRLRLEPPLAPDIVAHSSNSDYQKLRQLGDDMRSIAAEDPPRWSELNYEFRSLMYSLTGKPQTMRIISQLLNLVEPYSRVYVYLLAATDRVEQEHEAMLEAIREQDEERLSSYIRLHLEGARETLAKAMGEAESEAESLSRLLTWEAGD